MFCPFLISETSWHVDKVTIRESAHALQENVFIFNCWLEPASEEGEMSSVTITPPGNKMSRDTLTDLTT